MGGGLLQLVAYGAQDAYITGNPHITFWKVMYKRHTNFAMEAMRVNFTGAPAFGQRVVAVVNRNADLMYRTYVEVTLPDTSTAANGSPVLWTQGGLRRLGYLMIQQVELEIGGQVMDRQYGEWMFLWETLSSSFDQSFRLDAMVGGDQGGAMSTLASCQGRPTVLYIPLNFWFCRNPGLALPLIALQYHEVHINLIFKKEIDLVQGTAGTAGSIAAAAAALPDPKEAAIYIDYIYLDTDERRRFAQQSHEYLIDQLQYSLQQTLTTPNARIDLTLNHPVKELVWVFQDARKTDCGSTLSVAQGFTQPFSYDDIVDRCRIQINGQDRFDERYGDYFWKVQPYQHHTGGAFLPTRSAMAGSAGAIQTTAVTGGSGVVTIVNGVLTFVSTIALGGAGVIADNSVITSPTPGLIPAGLTVVANGTGTGKANAGDTYILSQPVTITIPSVTLTFTPPNVTFSPAFNPINVYSFALRPEEHQPSGTCNFSRIDTATLVFDSKTTGGAGTYPNKAYPYNFRMYAVNYNIFRVMSGMGGLAYSN